MKRNYYAENGQTIMEISLLIALVVLVIVSSIPSLRESVLHVFTRYSDQINGTVSGDNPNPVDPPIPLTPLGSSVGEISGGVLDLINDFYAENNHYPRSWGDYAYTDLGLDPAQWKDQEYDGIIYKPNGSLLRIRPGEGYSFRIQDENGETHVLPYSYNWDLVYRIANDNRWYYHSVEGPVVLIDTLEVIEP
jgi:Flp pilus assembly pilin Flp